MLSINRANLYFSVETCTDDVRIPNKPWQSTYNLLNSSGAAIIKYDKMKLCIIVVKKQS